MRRPRDSVVQMLEECLCRKHMAVFLMELGGRAEELQNHPKRIEEAETVEQALERIRSWFSAGEEEVILGLPKSLEHDIQVLMQRACGEKQMSSCKTSVVGKKSLPEYYIQEQMLGPDGRIAQETMGMENDELSGSQEVNAERSEAIGVCSTEEDVNLLMESSESAATRGEGPTSVPIGHVDDLVRQWHAAF